MTIWSTAGSGITLSGGNLTAKNEGNVGRIVKADISSLSGNSEHWQFEIHIDAMTKRPHLNMIVGLVNGSQSINTIFDGNNSVGYDANDG